MIPVQEDALVVGLSLAIICMFIVSWYRMHVDATRIENLEGKNRLMARELAKCNDLVSWTPEMHELAMEAKSKLEDLTIAVHTIRMIQSGEMELPDDHPLVSQTSRQRELERIVSLATAAHSKMLKEIRT